MAQTCDLVALLAVDIVRGMARNCLDIDIERIEKITAVRRVGTCLLCAIEKQCMKRVKPDAGCAGLGRDAKERRKVGKVAMTPILGRTNTVKLDRQNPVPLSIALMGRIERRRLRRRNGRSHALEQGRKRRDGGRARLLLFTKGIEKAALDAPSPGQFVNVLRSVHRSRRCIGRPYQILGREKVPQREPSRRPAVATPLRRKDHPCGCRSLTFNVAIEATFARRRRYRRPIQPARGF